MFPVPDGKRSIRNKPYSFFTSKLSWWVGYHFGLPFVDQAAYDFNIDISIDGKILDDLQLPELKNALRMYGLELTEEQTDQDVLVIKEKR